MIRSHILNIWNPTSVLFLPTLATHQTISANIRCCPGIQWKKNKKKTLSIGEERIFIKVKAAFDFMLCPTDPRNLEPQSKDLRYIYIG